MVLPQTGLSDHCKIVTELKHSYTHMERKDNHNWIKFPKQIKWDDKYVNLGFNKKSNRGIR